MEAWTLDNQLEANISNGFMDHTLLVGVDYQQRENDVSWPSGYFPPLNAFNPVYGSDPIEFYAPIRERHEIDQTGVYLQDQIALDNWRFTLGGRYDWVNIDNANRDSGDTSSLSDTQFSGRAGVVYLFDNGVAPYLSYSTAFTPTSFVDESGDLLQPMEGEQWETGVTNTSLTVAKANTARRCSILARRTSPPKSSPPTHTVPWGRSNPKGWSWKRKPS